MQVEAERRKRAAILESEGKREAAINIAEGEKRARILASEASMQEKINEARGKVLDFDHLDGTKLRFSFLFLYLFRSSD